MTVGNRKLKIIASQDLGQLGAGEAAPVFCQWRWHYLLPSFALWLSTAFLLVLWGRNRQRRGWAIAVAALLGIILLRMEGAGILVGSLVIVWIVVWRVPQRRGGPQRPGDDRPAYLQYRADRPDA